MRIGILLVFALACSPSAFGAGTTNDVRSLSLRQCLEMAISHNLDIQIQHLSGDIARFNAREAYGPYDPILTLSAEHRFTSDPSDFDPRKFNPYLPTDANVDTLDTALGGKLPFGLTYNFRAFGREDNVRTDFTSSIDDAGSFPGGIRETNNYVAGGSVTVQQHLLRDFWIDADRERLLVRRKELKMSEQELRFQLMRTLLAVELAYVDFIAAGQDVGVQEKAVELRRQLVTETRRRVEVGSLPPLEGEQAETQLQNSLTSLAASREQLVTRQNALKLLLSDDFKEWVDTDLRPADTLQATPVHVNRAESFALAERNRPDLAEARLAVQKSDVTVRFRYNQLFPSLDVVSSFGSDAVDAAPGPAAGDAFGFHNPDYFYGAVLTIPLGRISERAGYQSSKTAKHIAELQLKKAEQQVLVQIADLLNRVESRQAQITSTHQARVYAEAALSAEEKKLLNGYSTAFIVLQLQEILTAARTSEVQAVADYNKTLAELAFAQGTTFDRHHLTLDIR